MDALQQAERKETEQEKKKEEAEPIIIPKNIVFALLNGDIKDVTAWLNKNQRNIEGIGRVYEGDPYSTVLELAAESGRIDLVKLLIEERKVKVPKSILFHLRRGGRDNDVQLADLLLKHGADINFKAEGWTSPTYTRKRVGLVYFRQMQPGQFKITDYTPLMDFLVRGLDSKIIEFLIHNGADVCAVDSAGRSVLEYARNEYLEEEDDELYKMIQKEVKLGCAE